MHRPDAAAARRLTPSDAQGATGARGRVWDGIVWSRLGRGDHAWACWDDIDDQQWAPWIAAERGRVLRELGLHASAEALEAPAFDAARDPVERAMLAISLTADAVGRGDVALANQRLADAGRLRAETPDGPRAARQRLRLSWVRVEVALLTGRPPLQAGLPVVKEGELPDFGPDYRHGTDFHRAKGLLFAGVVSGSLVALDAASRIAPPVLAWAVHLARADAGSVDALAQARTAWSHIVPPVQVADAVAATPTAARLAGQSPTSAGSSMRPPSASYR